MTDQNSMCLSADYRISKIILIVPTINHHVILWEFLFSQKHKTQEKVKNEPCYANFNVLNVVPMLNKAKRLKESPAVIEKQHLRVPIAISEIKKNSAQGCTLNPSNPLFSYMLH